METTTRGNLRSAAHGCVRLLQLTQGLVDGQLDTLTVQDEAAKLDAAVWDLVEDIEDVI